MEESLTDKSAVNTLIDMEKGRAGTRLVQWAMRRVTQPDEPSLWKTVGMRAKLTRLRPETASQSEMHHR